MNITETIRKLGLYHDQALIDTAFIIEKIPCRRGSCPLGLYDPDTNTITLPPGYTKAALIHEIGHRIGHYYHHDLSEGFAERFRRGHSGGVALLVKDQDINNLPLYEPLFAEGESGMVDIAFGRPLEEYELASIANQLGAYPSLGVFYNPRTYTVRVAFTKGFPWLIAIGAVLLLGAAAGISFGLFKVTESFAKNMVPLALIGAGALILYVYIKKKRV